MDVAAWVLLAIFGCFGLGAVFGAPFLPIRKVDSEAALDLAELAAGQTMIDLGSGDGRLLVAAAKRGAHVIGYEINPLLYLYSRLATWRYRKQVRIYLRNFWQTPLPDADVIYVFLIGHHTDRLDQKLSTELSHPTKVVSYVFELKRKPIKQTANTQLYIYP